MSKFHMNMIIHHIRFEGCIKDNSDNFYEMSRNDAISQAVSFQGLTSGVEDDDSYTRCNYCMEPTGNILKEFQA